MNPKFLSRLLILGTRASLEVLAQADSIFSDGTFRYVNRLFSQLYTIHGRVKQLLKYLIFVLDVICVKFQFNGEILPLVYCYLPNKYRATYESAFTSIRNNEVSKK